MSKFHGGLFEIVTFEVDHHVIVDKCYLNEVGEILSALLWERIQQILSLYVQDCARTSLHHFVQYIRCQVHHDKLRQIILLYFF